jgi:hypothetical protein
MTKVETLLMMETIFYENPESFKYYGVSNNELPSSREEKAHRNKIAIKLE